MKKFISIAAMLAMLVSMLAVPVSAADESPNWLVLASQDYENIVVNPAATTVNTAENGVDYDSKIEYATENDNTYAKFCAGGSGYLKTWLAQGVDVGTTSWTVEFDMKVETPGSAFGLVTFDKNGRGHFAYVRTSYDSVGGILLNWNRYRVAYNNSAITVQYKNGEEWQNYPSDGWANAWVTGSDWGDWYGEPNYGGLYFYFNPSQINSGADVANTVICMDNIVLYNNEKADISGTVTGDVATAGLSFTDNDALASGTALNAYIAAYDSTGKLVDVAFKQGTYTTKLEVADLSLNVAGAASVKAYVWDAEGKPYMAQAFDITECFK